MLELDVDFRPPTVKESWFWILDTSKFGSDGDILPQGKDLQNERKALLLEYLPNARRMSESIITEERALLALGGVQYIQRALIGHGDLQSRNVLVTKDDRVVWIDFDRAEVVDSVDESVKNYFKKELVDVHQWLFQYMVGKFAKFGAQRH
jgi:RIO-like serine/threonine protein kinase